MARPANISDPQPLSEPLTDQLYWKDSYSWALEQADALRRRDFDAIDWENLIEEIEDLARSDARRLTSHYARIMEHLLKLQYRHPSETDPVAGWKHSIQQARTQVQKVLDDSHRPKATRRQVFAKAWLHGRRDAINAFVWQATKGIKLDSTLDREQKRLTREWRRALPGDNPYTLHQVETSFWYPDSKPLTHRPTPRSDPEHDWPR